MCLPRLAVLICTLLTLACAPESPPNKPAAAIAEPLPFPVPQFMTQAQHSGRELTIFANGIPVAFADSKRTSHMFQIGFFLVDLLGL